MATATRAERRRAEKASANGHLLVLNRDIFGARESLQKLLAKELPVRTGFALARLANALNGHLQAIESVRNQLVRKYGQPVDGKPGVFIVPAGNEKYPAFAAELDELMNIQVEVAANKVTLPACIAKDGTVAIEAGVFLALLPFVDIEEEPQ